MITMNITFSQKYGPGYLFAAVMKLYQLPYSLQQLVITVILTLCVSG